MAERFNVGGIEADLRIPLSGGFEPAGFQAYDRAVGDATAKTERLGAAWNASANHWQLANGKFVAGTLESGAVMTEFEAKGVAAYDAVGNAARRAEHQAGQFERGALGGIAGGRLGRLLTWGSGALIGGYGLEMVVRKMLSLSTQLQTANFRLDDSLRLRGWQVYRDEILKTNDALSKLTGYSKSQLESGSSLFATVARSPADIARMQRAALTLDARRPDIGYDTATKLIVRAAAGNTSTLSRYGIVVQKVTTFEDQLTAAHIKATPAMRRYAQEQDKILTGQELINKVLVGSSATLEKHSHDAEVSIRRFHDAFDRVLIALSVSFLPLVSKVADRISAWADAWISSGKAAQFAQSAVSFVEGLYKIISNIVRVSNEFAQAIGGWGNVVVLAGIYKMVGALGGIATAIRAISGAALLAKGNVVAMLATADAGVLYHDYNLFSDYFNNKGKFAPPDTSVSSTLAYVNAKLAAQGKDYHAVSDPLPGKPDHFKKVPNDPAALPSGSSAAAKATQTAAIAVERAKERVAARAKARQQWLMQGKTPYDSAYAGLDFSMSKSLALTPNDASGQAAIRRQEQAMLLKEAAYIQHEMVGKHGAVLEALYGKLKSIYDTYAGIATTMKSQSNELYKQIRAIQDFRFGVSQKYGSDAKPTIVHQTVHQHFGGKPSPNKQRHYIKKAGDAAPGAAGG